MALRFMIPNPWRERGFLSEYHKETRLKQMEFSINVINGPVSVLALMPAAWARCSRGSEYSDGGVVASEPPQLRRRKLLPRS